MSVERRVLTVDELAEWHQYYDRLASPGPYHDPAYIASLEGNFEYPDERAEAFVIQQGDEFVYYPYFRRSLESVSFADQTSIDLATYDDLTSSWYWGGPLATTSTLSESFVNAFGEYCAEAGIVAEFIRFDPNVNNHEQYPMLDPTFNRETVVVDLTGTKEEIWENYESRNQRAIRQAEETDITINKTRDKHDVAAFHEIYSDAMDARGAAEHYRFRSDFFESLISRPDLSTLFVAQYDGDVIGGFISVHDERIAHHYLSASEPDYWDMRVNNLLYHEVVMNMFETDRDVFDFQGGRPGVFRFKKGFSPGRGEFYIGNRVHNQPIYDRLVADAASAGINTESSYFPAYRVEQSN